MIEWIEPERAGTLGGLDIETGGAAAGAGACVAAGAGGAALFCSKAGSELAKMAEVFADSILAPPPVSSQQIDRQNSYNVEIGRAYAAIGELYAAAVASLDKAIADIRLFAAQYEGVNLSRGTIAQELSQEGMTNIPASACKVWFGIPSNYPSGVTKKVGTRTLHQPDSYLVTLHPCSAPSGQMMASWNGAFMPMISNIEEGVDLPDLLSPKIIKKIPNFTTLDKNAARAMIEAIVRWGVRLETATIEVYARITLGQVEETARPKVVLTRLTKITKAKKKTSIVKPVLTVAVVGGIIWWLL